MNSSKFTSWFTNRLTVGPYPGEKTPTWSILDYDILINVSGEYYGEYKNYTRVDRHWFPMSEQKADMGVNSIFGAMIVLWNAEKTDKNVYLHCHSGSNRSRTVKAAYYYMRTGSHVPDPHKCGNHLNKLLANCDRHYLPAQAEMEAWLRALAEGLKKGLSSDLLTRSKLETINNF